MTRYIDPKMKLLQHLDRLATLKNGQYTPPVNVEIDLSNRCSLGCEWCHFAYTHTRGPLAGQREKPVENKPGGDLMDYELAQQIISTLALEHVLSVTWTGGGEPTLHPRFDDIIEYTSKQPLDQGLYTHGGHLSRERAELIKRCMTWVYVSLDCSDRETYAEEKGADRFEAACQGIRNLATADGSATVGVGFLIHKDNYKRASDMLALAIGLGADYAQFRPAVYFDMHNPAMRQGEADWIDEALPELEKLSELKQCIVDTNRFKMYRDWRGHGYDTCYWAGLQTIITPDGSLWICGNKREQASGWLGNMNHESFRKILTLRGGAQEVNDTCRVLCRGHVPNVALQDIMLDLPHKNFI
jgi:MoaA/NifB/PqqE/SkfB family radical SAM enzyme